MHFFAFALHICPVGHLLVAPGAVVVALSADAAFAVAEAAPDVGDALAAGLDESVVDEDEVVVAVVDVGVEVS